VHQRRAAEVDDYGICLARRRAQDSPARLQVRPRVREPPREDRGGRRRVIPAFDQQRAVHEHVEIARSRTGDHVGPLVHVAGHVLGANASGAEPGGELFGVLHRAGEHDALTAGAVRSVRVDRLHGELARAHDRTAARRRGRGRAGRSPCSSATDAPTTIVEAVKRLAITPRRRRGQP
jgi:hypothetical protein